MHLFVHEFVTGGGWYSAAPGEQPPGGLATEGRAMLAALAADLAKIEGARISTLRDIRWPALDSTACESVAVESLTVDSAAAERIAFAKLAARADWTIVIAPEFEGFLAERSRWVIEAGGRLLGMPVPLVELAADKQRTAEHLAWAGIPAPPARLIEPYADVPADFEFPAVVKPLDGAGSLGVRLLGVRGDYLPTSRVPLRLEQYCPGLTASIACLCGPGRRRILPACEQVLSQDGMFRYLGGRTPLSADLDRRAHLLAARVLECCPTSFGYLGIDLVLGDDPLGRHDYVIEINPRLTTSYIGLRRLAHENLGAALLAMAAGHEPALTFSGQQIRFAADGRLL